MMAGSPALKQSTSWSKRNWCFVKVYTDEGITGLGEGSGWPRVVETAINDLKPIVIGEDPMNIERIWQKMLVSTMGAGMTGTPGSGSMNAIDMALWDIKGKALNTPVWNLLGGKVRDRIRAYGHAKTPERALELKERGLTAVKTGGVHRTVEKVDAIRKAVGDEMDIMVDAHGPPWFTTKDAIVIGKALEPYKLLFYEDPVPPDNIEALQRVQDNVDIPIAAGERHSHIWGVRQLIEREIVDVVQPDTGRIGGISQMMKIAAMAEAHYITVAPHSGSLGPVAEYAAIHVLAAIPNALILERVHDDVPVRYDVTLPHIETIDGHIEVPDRPGLGVDIDEDVVLAHPSKGNTSRPGTEGDGDYESGTFDEHVYVQSRYRRQKTMGTSINSD
ncbi:MAG: mandelate racemase/muconate lactonizing enzyme family protein [SAR202 cluster bacterium]|nr:MAG: mandelate racemase/muconate lactonizing enzyme family protein [SAR202 cluster bacterium]MCH2530827.1 mandelate racemase/muconate lactonizing enzyme family protein [Dehalococcoidia bacterium]MQF63942.1 mandelate racemase/muconate lactonizing enzyme family protein [SAR202 cluster bacterium AD-802-L14_MRT_200m]KAA1298786.1 MAG: mandelate racemase/muconate lactonizing enzyme family protein [SAR202 cluster bacterium]KAA1303164.1 MAG: mandelate racemase/muconate lactonizing enzyme family prot